MRFSNHGYCLSINRGLAVCLIPFVCAMLAPTIADGQSSHPSTTSTDLGSNFVDSQPAARDEFVTRPVVRSEAPHPVNHASHPPANTPPPGVNAVPAATSQPTLRKIVTQTSLPLRPPSASTGSALSKTAPTNMMVVVKALALVLGLFFGAIWVARRGGWKSSATTNPGIFQVMGEFPLASRRKATIVKFGTRLLVLADSPRGMEKITEVTDPAEVEQVVQMCQPQFGGQTVSSIQDWMRERGLQSGTTSELPSQST